MGARKQRTSKSGQHKPQPYLAEVEWVDATSHSGWLSMTEALEQTPAVMTTAGYVIEKNKKVIRLVRSLEKSNDFIGDVFQIPSPWIIKVTRK